MCGLVGLYNPKFSQDKIRSRVKKMNQLIQHRGPNGEGYYSSNSLPFAMGMKRLAIMDVELGNQPLHSRDNRFHFIFNGEITNAKPLKKYLIEKYDTQFTTLSSDTEVAFNLILKEGINSIYKLNGMFAFCLYDSLDNEIFLARDRSGIKPLYYSNIDNCFTFSSEIKPLLINEFISKQINLTSLVHFSSMMYTPGPSSIFSQIKKIDPGTILQFNLSSNYLKKHIFYEIKFGSSSKKKIEEVSYDLKNIFDHSINRWCESDVPISCSLSGGVDSTSIAYCMKRQNIDFSTYSLGFDNENYQNIDESDLAEDTSKVLNKRFTKIIYKTKNFLNDIDECIESLEEPYAGGFPSWPLFREVKKERKVIIVGTGGDELFGNYGKWKRLFLVNKFKKINLELFKKYYFDLFYYCSDEEKKTIFSFNIEKHQPTSNYLYDIYSNSDFSNPIDQVANLDFKTQLPYEFLFMTDKFSMAHSVEARPVYLDNNLIEYVSKLNSKIRTSLFNIKKLQKNSLNDYLPDKIMQRKKQGFVLPIEDWIIKKNKSHILSLFDKRKIIRQDIFDKDILSSTIIPILESKIKVRYQKVWSLYMFQLWYDKFIKL